MSLRIIFVSFFLYYFVLNDSNYSCNLIDKSRILEYQLLNIIQTNEADVYIIYIFFQVWNQRIFRTILT